MGAITSARPVVSGGVRIGVAVESVKFSSKIAIDLSGAPTSEVADATVGKAVDVVDPDGNHIWLYQPDFGSPVVGEDSTVEGTE